jgi:chromosome segregation ATPase
MAALTDIQAALALGQGEEDIKRISGTLNARKATPLSYYILIGGTTISAIVSISAYILNQPQFALLGAWAFLNGALGAYQTWRLRTLQDLEANVTELTQRIQELYKENVQGRKSNKELGLETEKLKATVKAYKQLLLIDSLKTQELAGQIDELTVKLQKTEKKLSKLTEIYEPLKAAINQFIDVSSHFLKDNQTAQETLQKIQADLEKTHLLEQDWQNEEEALEASIASIKKSCEQVTIISILLQKGIKELQLEIDDSQTERKLIDTQIKELNEMNQKLTEKIAILDRNATQREEFVKQLRELLPNEIKLDEQMRLLKQQNEILLAQTRK